MINATSATVEMGLELEAKAMELRLERLEASLKETVNFDLLERELHLLQVDPTVIASHRV